MSAGLLACAVVAVVAQSPEPAAEAPDPAADAPDAAPDTTPDTSALNACHALLEAHELDKAEDCYRVASTLSGDEGKAARAFVELLETRRAPIEVPAPVAPSVAAEFTTDSPGGDATDDASAASVAQRRFEDGTAEGVVQGALLGAGGGFLLTGAALSAKRTDRADSLPWIIAGPVIGGAAGAIAAYLVLDELAADAHDASLVASMTWMSGIATFVLELALFNGNTDVRFIPVAMLLALGGGLAGTAAGVATSLVFDVSAGDVALANSAALWSVVLMGIALSIETFPGRDFGATAMLMDAALVVPYAVVLAAHSKVEVNRFATWFIEAGGVSGLLVGAAVLNLGGWRFGLGPQETLLVTTSAGLVSGVALMLLTDSVLDEAPP